MPALTWRAPDGEPFKRSHGTCRQGAACTHLPALQMFALG